MNAFMLGAAPQRALPASKRMTEIRYSHFALKMPNNFPLHRSCQSSVQPISGRDHYQVIIVAEPDSTKATPSQLSFPTSPNRLTIGDCTSATIVLSSEKRKVEERIVRTMRIHCSGLVDMSDAIDNKTHQRFGDLGLEILLNKVHILNSFLSTILAFSIHIGLSHVKQRRKEEVQPRGQGRL